MPGKMLSLVSVAALVAAVAAHPYPECEPCAAVSNAELEGLSNSNKYLCCDPSCATDPVAGCGIFGLPIVCKACYDGDGTPAYDDDPIDGDGDGPSPTPTAEPVMPVAPPVAATPEPVMPVAPPVAATPEPVMPVMPVAPPVATSEPVRMPAAAPDESMSYGFDPEDPDSEEAECTACDEADMVLSEMDWEAMEADGYELVCDPTCFEDATMDGCGAFGLPIECRAVPVDDAPAPAPAPTPVATGGGEGEGGGEDSGEETGEGEGEGGGEDSGEETGEGEGEGGGEDGGEETGGGEGEGGGEDSGEETGEGEGEGGGETGGGGCTAEEIAQCADYSPAEAEALAMYDNGGKVIVCDPTCDTSPSHCNYFDLGPRCRGCGSCSTCVPCP